MKNKIISIALFCVLAYLLPLLKNIELLFSIKIFVIISFVFVLFLTQPALSFSEAQQKHKSDQNSVWLIIGGCFLCQLFSVFEWKFYNQFQSKLEFDMMSYWGFSLMLGGTAFRLWAIRTLGNFFTSTVQTKQNHRVITVGAYSFLRHPSYLGAYLTIIGCSLWLGASFSACFSAILMFYVYQFRMKVEEETLINQFGELYRNYQQKTFKIFPFVY